MLSQLSKINGYFNSYTSTQEKWVFGNSVLYRMCEESPVHTDIDEIVGKLWLIGRSYAAAIERRKGGQESSDDFYYDVVGPKMLEIGSELDRRLNELRGYQSVSEDNLALILSTHKFLLDAFESITGLEKRSLASKYLHFHCPALFYIYDSRSNMGIRKYVKLDKSRVYRFYPCGCDQEYADFSVRMLEMQEYLFSKGFNVSPRDLDNFLLYNK